MDEEFTLPWMQHPLVRQMAQKYQKHVLSLLLRWGIQRNNSVLAKSSNPHHIRGNLEGCLGWQISDSDMHQLSTIEFQLRLVDGIRFLRPEGPFRHDLLSHPYPDYARLNSKARQCVQSCTYPDLLKAPQSLARKHHVLQMLLRFDLRYGKLKTPGVGPDWYRCLFC